MRHYRFISTGQNEFHTPDVCSHDAYSNNSIMVYVNGTQISFDASQYWFDETTKSVKVYNNFFKNNDIVDIYIDDNNQPYYNNMQGMMEKQFEKMSDVVFPELANAIARKLYLLGLPKDELIKKVLENPDFIKELPYIDEDIKTAVLFKNEL